MPTRKIKVLIVDDSAIARKLLQEALAGEEDIEVVGAAPDPYVARDLILRYEPDVMTLDIEMPRMDGLTFLKKIMRHHPMPVIVISSMGGAGRGAAEESLRLGAVEVLAKSAGPYSLGELKNSLPAKIRAAAAGRLRLQQPGALFSSPSAIAQPAPVKTGVLIAIGASTGGTEAIREVLQGIPADCPPILIAQHIPAGFSTAFADTLNQLCPMEVKEAEDGDALRPGLALVAPGNYHLTLHQDGAGNYLARVHDGPKVWFQRPSVDVLFESVAEAAQDSAIGVLLTGMGKDGAQGLLRMRQAGAQTIAQDEESCVVFGMPAEAIQIGAVERVLPLSRIAPALVTTSLATRGV
jgi:two-component system, chemotaxis family, protein-glutamate methylesterase/glutaminase